MEYCGKCFEYHFYAYAGFQFDGGNFSMSFIFTRYISKELNAPKDYYSLSFKLLMHNSKACSETHSII